jgi:aspartyl-tRNA(Asn)/glutamyl-tRNA(Gln) amidotransferase subunit A
MAPSVSLEQTLAKLRSGEVRAESLVQDCLDRIGQVNGSVNAVIELNPEALKQAQQIDAGDPTQGRLRGVPILVKDNLCVQGMKATAASRILSNFKPPYTAHCISRLQQEGAIILGKTNMDEFAMGSSNENSNFGACRNPWNLHYVPGGSSGGSAAAVAAGMAAVAVGSDTGGSIRQPASYCGVVGIKPSYGSVSRYGMIAFASSLDQVGSFGRNVEGAARVLEVMVDKDPRDGTNVKVPFSSLWSKEKRPLRGCRVGVPHEYMAMELDEDLRKSLDDLYSMLEKEGAEVVPIHLPHTDYAISVYYLVAASEASSNLSRYDGVRYGLRELGDTQSEPLQGLDDFYKRTRSQGFGDEVKRRILLGTFALSAGYFDAFYTKACQVRRLIADDFNKAFQFCDFILGPVATSPAFKVGEKVQDPVAMYDNDKLTTPASLAGLPSMSLPLALNASGLPLGLQVVAPLFQDDKMVAMAASLEELIDFKEVCHVE